MAQTIAFLGLGSMGLPMARRLLAAGFELTVWNRSDGPAQELVAEGARVGATPADTTREAAVVISILSDAEAVAAVLLGPDGAIEGLAPGALVCEMSTLAPADARPLVEACGERGLRFVDAPVYGSVGPAAEGKLAVLAGGAKEDVEALSPVFDHLGRVVFHAGPVGCGYALKLAVNLVGGHVITGIAGGLELARSHGVDGGMFLEALEAGSFTSPLVELKGRRKMLPGDHSPHFTMELFLKDMRLAAETARATSMRLPTLDAMVALLERASAEGLEKLDLSAVVDAIAPERKPG